MPEVKRIDSNNSKIKHTDELRAHLLDKEGNKIPHSVFETDKSSRDFRIEIEIPVVYGFKFD